MAVLARFPKKEVINKEEIKDGYLRCSKCKRIKPDEEFTKVKDNVHRRGRHYTCKQCLKDLNNKRRKSGHTNISYSALAFGS